METNVSTQPIIPYSITLEDVQAYLDSKKSSEPIGITGDPCKCLLAQALAFKYPEQTFVVGLHSFSLDTTVVPWQHCYDHALEQIVSDFDSLGIDEDSFEQNEQITKAQWLQAMQASTLRTGVLDG